MATYYQEHIIPYEDGFGQVHRRYVVSDSYDGLFSSSALELSKGFLNFGDLEEANEDADGNLIQNEVDFTASGFEAHVNNNNDACLTLLKTSKDINNKVYVAIFDPPDNPLTTSNLRFSGIVQQEYEIEDKKWNLTHWGVNRVEIQDFSFVASPFSGNLLNIFSLDQIVNGDNANSITGIDSTWEGNNVIDGLGYYDDGDFNIKYGDLVNSNRMIRKLADSYEQALTANGYGTYSIHFNRCSLPGEYVVMRFNNDYDGLVSIARIGLHNEVWNNDLSLFDKAVKFDDDTSHKLYLDPSNPSGGALIETQYWDYKMFKHRERLKNGEPKPYEQSLSGADNFRLTKRVDSFGEFLYRLAHENGLHLQIRIENNDIYVDFINPSDFTATKVYFKDASQSSESFISDAKGDKFFGKSSYFIKSGLAYYRKENGEIRSEANQNTNDGKVETMFTTGVALGSIQGGFFGNKRVNWWVFPHNTVIARGSNSGDAGYPINRNVLGVSSNIFLWTSKRVGGHTTEPANYFAPSRGIAVNIDGIEKYFIEKSEYLNFIHNRRLGYTKYTKKLTVDSWNLFSENTDGSLPSWKFIKPLNEIELDGRTYSIRKVKTSMSLPKVEIEMEAKEVYSGINDPSSKSTTSNQLQGLGASYNYSNANSFVDGTTVKHGLLVRKTNGDWKPFVHGDDYQKQLAIALEAGTNTDIEILPIGKELLYESDHGFDIGSKVYLKTDATTQYEITSDILEAKATNNDLYAQIGIVTSNNTIQTFYGEMARLK